MGAIETVQRVLATIVDDWQCAWPQKATIEPPKDCAHGDLSTNLAMLLAKERKKNPREIAQELAALLTEKCADIKRVDVAGPGFCNIVFHAHFWQKVVGTIEEEGASFGCAKKPTGKKVLVEFVSANPTGPLHVGHGRGAAVGESLARLLRAAGHTVDTEYYVNDAGRQMRLLGLSVYLRACELQNKEVQWPEEYYHGGYIRDLAREMLTKEPHLLELAEDEAKAMCQRFAMETILEGIVKDLHAFRVDHDRYFSEKSLVDAGAVERAFAALDQAGRTYEKDGAYWFATEKLGDDRDRVLRKSDGSLTYFASDIAYHHNKYERGYDWLIDVWGADHHGYVARMRAAIQAMGQEQSSFDVILIQLVNLLRDGKPLSMSTRAGTFETLEDVVADVGVDAARFMFLSRKSDSPLDFDLELVRKRNLENPVFYVQYAHARIHGILRRAKEQGIALEEKTSAEILSQLSSEDCLQLLQKIASYPDVVASAARSLGVHHISHYLMDLAGLVHSFYAKEQILGSPDPSLVLAKLALLRAIAQVIANGLDLLGVEAPQQML